MGEFWPFWLVVFASVILLGGAYLNKILSSFPSSQLKIYNRTFNSSFSGILTGFCAIFTCIVIPVSCCIGIGDMDLLLKLWEDLRDNKEAFYLAIIGISCPLLILILGTFAFLESKITNLRDPGFLKYIIFTQTSVDFYYNDPKYNLQLDYDSIESVHLGLVTIGTPGYSIGWRGYSASDITIEAKIEFITNKNGIIRMTASPWFITFDFNMENLLTQMAPYIQRIKKHSYSYIGRDNPELDGFLD